MECTRNFPQGYSSSKSVATMHSCKFYLSKNIDDLRRELASRDLPTEGLKKDLAWRLASLDDAHDNLRTSASSSMTSNEDGMITKTESDNVPTTKVRGRPKKSSSSPIGLSLGSGHGHHDSDDDRHVSNLARFLITFTKGIISILLIAFLSCVLWHKISMANKEFFKRSIKNCYDLLSSNINNSWDMSNSHMAATQYRQKSISAVRSRSG